MLPFSFLPLCTPSALCPPCFTLSVTNSKANAYVINIITGTGA